MDKVVVLFTMKQCPFCHMLKEMLDKEGVEYVDRDIHEYEEEYNLFVEVTENEFVPAFMLIESPEDNPVTRLFAPDRDFEDINQGAKIIKEFRRKSNKPVFKGAFINNEIYIGDDLLDSLASLKSKEEVIGEIIGLLQSPAKRVISALLAQFDKEEVQESSEA